MSSHYVQPPWEFLLSASRNSLQSYELSRLSHAANLRKEMTALMNQWIEETSAAMLARWLMEHRERESAEPQPFPGRKEVILCPIISSRIPRARSMLRALRHEEWRDASRRMLAVCELPAQKFSLPNVRIGASGLARQITLALSRTSSPPLLRHCASPLPRRRARRNSSRADFCLFNFL